MRYIDSGQRDSSQALGSWMQDLDASTVVELRLQTGFFGIEGIALLLPVLDHLRNVDGIARCLIGSNDAGTGGGDVRELADVLGLPRSAARLAVCAFSSGFFHPKVVHFKLAGGDQIAYVGSANLTRSGVLGHHVEAGMLLDTRLGDNQHELGRIAASIDRWFDDRPPGFFLVEDASAVEPLVNQGVLAKAVDPVESRPPSRKSASGDMPKLPALAPLLVLSARKQGKPAAATASSSAESAAPTARNAPASSAGKSQYFMMELSKNRISGSSYQADIGKSAFTKFFNGTVGGHVDVLVNTVTVGSPTKVPKERQLVNVKSKNYRLEIDFPHDYPTTGRPVVMFRRLTANEFDCLLLMPDAVGYAEALATLDSFADPVSGSRMRRAILDSLQLKSSWPGCPLL